jgi:hypothetical protein
MENYYQKKQLKELNQSETSIPLTYKNEFSLKDKETMYKEIYHSIDFFDQIIREALQDLKGSSLKQDNA